MSLNTNRTAKRTALVAATALSTVFISGVPAVAQPDQPANASQALQKLRELSKQAEILTEDYKKAQDDHEAKEKALHGFTDAAAQAEKVAGEAHAQEEALRGKVDELSQASYKGSRMNTLSALVGSERPKQFLDRAAALDLLSTRNNRAVHDMASATHRAEEAKKQARDAEAKAAKAEQDAARLEGDIAKRKEQMDDQISQVKDQYSNLSEDDKDILEGVSSAVGQLAGSGTAIKAVNAALSKQGSPYVYGAKGPSQFDCSGLVQWAYQQAGVSLPGSTRSQVSVGKEVSQSNMKPGDIIFFYSSASHDGIYIGNGKMVHAPTEGQDVTVEEVQYMGEVNSVRRVAG